MADLELQIAFHGRDWIILKKYLEDMQKKKIGLLIQCKSHDESNQIRGSLSTIANILALESAALRAAQQGTL